MNINTIIFIGAVYLIATMIQRICGFGMGIVAIMILPYFTGSHAHTAASSAEAFSPPSALSVF